MNCFFSVSVLLNVILKDRAKHKICFVIKLILNESGDSQIT